MISDTAVPGTGRKHSNADNDIPANDATATDIETAQRSAHENDTLDKVLQQLCHVDTNDLPDQDDIQKHSDFAYAQRTDDNLKHLWFRAEAGSSELCVVRGL